MANAAGIAATMAASAAAAAQRRVLEQLRGKGADRHERAAPFHPAQRGDERYLESLLNRGAVVEASAGRYWVNERVLQSRVKTGPVIVILILALLLIGLGAVLLGAGL